MMKPLRRTLALLLCLSMTLTAASALAATKTPSKTFTAVPTLKITDSSKRGTKTGELDDLTLSASLPGFLNLYLLDENGSIALTIAKDLEIHSNSTTFDFYAVDDNGDLLAPGTYTFRAEMVSQFGVASKAVTKNITILENPEAEAEAAAKAAKAAAESQASTETAETVETTKSTEQTASAEQTDSAKDTASSTASTSSSSSSTAAASSSASYQEGSYVMGDEGLQIGVGVSDTASQTEASYWTLDASASDEEIWAAITRKMTGVDVGENESAYIYDSPESGREKLGTVSGISQGLNVILNREDGWSLVEAFRNEDGAFVRGYIKTNKLRTTDPNVNYGIVIDKATQTLTVYKDGARLGSCKVSTGLATTKYPHRETPAGEFITVTRRGSYEYYGMGYTRYTIRINGSYYLAEIPTTKKNGTTYLDVKDSLGSKATRGTICIAHDASTDGGINAEWIWNMTDSNKKVKVLIFDDKARSEVPVSDN